MQPFELGYPNTGLRTALVEAVFLGQKTATSSLRTEYAPYTTDPLPRPGERFLMLGFDDEPVGVVETTDVRVVSACDVDFAFARDEGEGFDTVAEWREAHETYWIRNGIIEALTDETLVVCERFRLVERIEPK